jgi:hypothetical protein
VVTFAFTVKVTDATTPQPMTASRSLSIKVGPNDGRGDRPGKRNAVHRQRRHPGDRGVPLRRSGNLQPSFVITGADTGLVAPSGLTFDHAGHLWVANAGANTLTEYAAGASGDAQPVATISGSSSGLSGP